jgi:hypothetical protein
MSTYNIPYEVQMGIRGMAPLIFALNVSGWLMPCPGRFTPGREPIWMDMEKGKSLSPTWI